MHEVLFRILNFKGGKPPLFFMRSRCLDDSGQMRPAAVLFFFVITVLSFVFGFHISKFSPLFVIGLVGSIIIGTITLVNTNFALVIMIFSMLLSPEIGGKLGAAGERGVSLRVEDFLIIAVFFVWLTKITLNRELGLVRRTPLNRPIFLYICANIFCTALGILSGYVRAKQGFFFVLKFVEFFMIYFLFVNNLRNMKQLKVFLFCFLLTSFIIGILTYSQAGSPERPSAPFEGEHAEPNTLGAYLLICLALALGLFLNLNFSLTKNILAGLVCFNIYPLLMTLSRSSYLGFIFSYIWFIFLNKKGRLLLVSVFAIAILFLPFIAPKKTIDRVVYTFTGKVAVGSAVGLDLKIDASAAARIESWSYVLDRLKTRPFFGYGVTGLGLVDSQYARTLGELGIIGSFSLLWLLFAILKNTWHVYHIVEDEYSSGLALGFLCGFLGLLIVGFGANIFVIVRVSEPFWFLAACVMVLPEIANLNVQEKNLEDKLVYR